MKQDPIIIKEFKDYPIMNYSNCAKLKLNPPNFFKGEPSGVYFELYNLNKEKIATIITYQQPPKLINGVSMPANLKMPGLKPNIIDISGEPKIILRVLPNNNVNEEIHIRFNYSIQ